ncbi:uncharacterized protein MELLADRAFT_114655 [Melampsora larici-populina 98AG31]|uniref:Uncharacterized protein n=1 Tax=Melampsora larici-populina (strain 98AG31 / pathotype 3-4-7) TaxID=747676 RepID=F4SEA6_MELLP|nr:uncharacterized protein MELLADRAFT_114655 [Melampsora larici-populina 98AG31]EGF97020.1 hypothetical protein MELLADRAFT_114655 [Melampsora larici-populina 98AG31]
MLTGRSLSSVTNLPVLHQVTNQASGTSSGKIGGNRYKGRHYNPLFDRSLNHHPAPYFHPNPQTYNADFNPPYQTYQRGGNPRGGGRGNAPRGSRGRGNGTRPAIGPGSFDRNLGSAGVKNGEKAVGSTTSNSTDIKLLNSLPNNCYVPVPINIDVVVREKLSTEC